MMKHIFTLTLLCLCQLTSMAQNTQSLADNIRTLQVKPDGEWGLPPVLTPGKRYVEISFDDMQRQYVRYTYRIIHCNADWTPSDIYYGDYMTGMNETDIISTYTPSRNTEMKYNHYQFQLPNSRHNLLVSGNYKVEIIDADEEETVAVVCFSKSEDRVSISASVTANTDIDTFDANQQVEMTINHQHLSTSNPEREIMPVVIQNHRWDMKADNLRPTYMSGTQLIYNHNRNLIFAAGNEYRRFEILDRHVATKGVERMRLEDKFYHAYIFTDEPRRNYKYDEDQNGRFLIHNGDNQANDTQSDYFITHFALKMPKQDDGKIYINGDLSEGQFTDDYMLDYNDMEHQYEIALSLKQGSYNYQYLYVQNGTTQGSTMPAEGNFHQTENEYQIYVYFRQFGGRYDRLIGFRTITYKE